MGAFGQPRWAHIGLTYLVAALCWDVWQKRKRTSLSDFVNAYLVAILAEGEGRQRARREMRLGSMLVWSVAVVMIDQLGEKRELVVPSGGVNPNPGCCLGGTDQYQSPNSEPSPPPPGPEWLNVGEMGLT